MKELKKGDAMHKSLQRVKQLVSYITSPLQNKNPSLCLNCTSLPEISELKKLIKDRLFDASNEGETTLEGMEISF